MTRSKVLVIGHKSLEGHFKGFPSRTPTSKDSSLYFLFEINVSTTMEVGGPPNNQNILSNEYHVRVRFYEPTTVLPSSDKSNLSMQQPSEKQ